MPRPVRESEKVDKVKALQNDLEKYETEYNKLKPGVNISARGRSRRSLELTIASLKFQIEKYSPNADKSV
jgi:hypothetical protein